MISAQPLFVFASFGNGHHLYDEYMHDVSTRLVPSAVQTACDKLPFPGPADQPEGQVFSVPAIPGWSYVTWWDRQGDRRGNSHTGLLVQGEYTPEALIEEARRRVPWAFRVEVRR